MGLSYFSFQVSPVQVPESTSPLAHKERPKVAGSAVHLHGAGIANGDEEPVGRLEKCCTCLIQREEAGSLTPRPAGASGRLHEQNGDSVGAHLQDAKHKDPQAELFHKLRQGYTGLNQIYTHSRNKCVIQKVIYLDILIMVHSKIIGYFRV